MRGTLAILTLLAVGTAPIHANQSAGFHCIATQGWAWQGSSAVTAERIDLTVQPDHLDVEHELTIDARTAWNGNPSHPDALEIKGRLEMAKGAVMVGLLLWNGSKILKGKLQTKEMARRKYEEVVDRNVKDPPPPRDPAILEKVGENAYDLSIFPVSLNGSRRIRIRYVIPSSYHDGAHPILFPHAFSSNAAVTVRGGKGLKGYALTSLRPDGSEFTVKNVDAVETPVALFGEAYNQFQPFRYWQGGSGGWLRHVTPLFGADATRSLILAGEINGPNDTRGHVSHVIFRPPADFLGTFEGKAKVVAVIRTPKESVEKKIFASDAARQGFEELRLYSDQALEGEISWKLYHNDVLTSETVEKPHVIRFEDGNQLARTFGSVPFYPMAASMPRSLAAAWGFIDMRYALLALEQDALKPEVAALYAKAGVPTLGAGDIFPEDGAVEAVPLSAWMLQRNLDRDALLEAKPENSSTGIAASGLPAGLRWFVRDGSVHVEIDPAARKAGLRVSLHGLDGKLLKEWGAGEMSGGRLSWAPRAAGYSAAICMLRIVSGGRAHTVRIVLR